MKTIKNLFFNRQENIEGIRDYKTCVFIVRDISSWSRNLVRLCFNTIKCTGVENIITTYNYLGNEEFFDPKFPFQTIEIIRNPLLYINNEDCFVVILDRDLSLITETSCKFLKEKEIPFICLTTEGFSINTLPELKQKRSNFLYKFTLSFAFAMNCLLKERLYKRSVAMSYGDLLKYFEGKIFGNEFSDRRYNKSISSFNIIGIGGIGNILSSIVELSPTVSYANLWDDDVLDMSNLNRFLRASYLDVGRNKILLATSNILGLHHSRVNTADDINPMLIEDPSKYAIIADCRDKIYTEDLVQNRNHVKHFKLSYNGGSSISIHTKFNELSKYIIDTDGDNSYEITPSFIIPPLFVSALFYNLLYYEDFYNLCKYIEFNVDDVCYELTH